MVLFQLNICCRCLVHFVQPLANFAHLSHYFNINHLKIDGRDTDHSTNQRRKSSSLPCPIKHAGGINNIVATCLISDILGSIIHALLAESKRLFFNNLRYVFVAFLAYTIGNIDCAAKKIECLLPFSNKMYCFLSL